MKYDTVCAVQGAKHRGSVYKKKHGTFNDCSSKDLSFVFTGNITFG